MLQMQFQKLLGSAGLVICRLVLTLTVTLSIITLLAVPFQTTYNHAGVDRMWVI